MAEARNQTTNATPPATCGTDLAAISHPPQGTMTFPNGDTFEGEYVRSLDKATATDTSLRQGQGKYTFAAGGFFQVRELLLTSTRPMLNLLLLPYASV